MNSNWTAEAAEDDGLLEKLRPSLAPNSRASESNHCPLPFFIFERTGSQNPAEGYALASVDFFNVDSEPGCAMPH